MKTVFIYFIIKLFILWQVETHGIIGYFIKGMLEIILGYELTYN